MASATAELPTLTRSRRRAFVLPREHGAWGMLLIPLLTGALAGHPRGERILWILTFAVAALGLFCLRTPVEAWLEISPLRPQTNVERKLTYHSILIYASVSGMALAFLLLSVRAYGLLLLGAAAATTFLLQALLKQLGKATRMNAQLTGAVALTSTAAGAYYLATGRLDRSAIMIWAANWLFAADQIHFVQLRIHSARASTPAEKFVSGRSFLLHQFTTLLFLGVIWQAGWLPGLALLAFGPIFFRGLAWYLESPRPLEVHRLGISELLYTLVFGGLFIAGFCF
jgi:hypothetical protein